MFFVYVLRSQSSQRFYTGQTERPEERIQEHQDGMSRSTKGGGPWELVHQERFATRAEAMKREKELKTGKGRDELKRILELKSKGSNNC